MADLGSIESIESLVHEAHIEDGVYHVVFQTRSDDEQIRVAIPVVEPDEEEGTATNGGKESFFFSVIRSANGLIRDVLGYNATVLGTTTAVDSKLDEAAEEDQPDEEPTVGSLDELSEEEREDLLYRAFEQVMHRFAWDPSDDEWVVVHEARGLGSELQRQLKLAPLESKKDRDVLTYMLLDIASADDEVDRAEQEFLLDFVDREKLLEGRNIHRARVSQSELRETSPGQPRETLYMLACAVALADHKFDPAESDRLEFYEKGLNLEEHRAEELLEAAQKYFLEQYMVRRFADTGELDEEARDGVVELAENLGYDTDQAELAFERYKRVQESGGGFSSGISW
ncbi:MAG: hypothetical protein ACOCV2_06650 [Persicimonas sp.]